MLSQEQIQHFEKNGYVAVEQLITKDECEQLKGIVKELIDQWNPDSDTSCIFSTAGNREQSRSQYFIDSADKIAFFLEEDAIDANTKKFNREKHQSINKIGHALHVLEPEFRRISFSDKVKAILQDINFIKPAICQSMYIFKQAYIGGQVVPHQDGTYLFNDPLKVAGVWIALEDATIENGCLWFIPGSQTRPITRRYIRNPNQEEFNEGKMLIFTGTEGPYDEKDFVPVEVKAGDAIVIHGQVVHKSEKNTSPHSRQIYAFHVIETHNSDYSRENWLQTKDPFPLVYGA